MYDVAELSQAAPHTRELTEEGVVRPDGALEEVVEVILAQLDDRQKPPVEYVGEPGEKLVGPPEASSGRFCSCFRNALREGECSRRTVSR
jgi:hypothetical protein